MTIQMEGIALWDPVVPSDGLTYDTPLGDVDLVAIDRARAGHHVQLTEAELTFLALDLGRVTDFNDPGQLDARALLCQALNLSPKAVSHLITTRLAREGR